MHIQKVKIRQEEKGLSLWYMVTELLFSTYCNALKGGGYINNGKLQWRELD